MGIGKNLRVTINFYKKQRFPVITRNKKHLSKQDNRIFTVAMLLKVCELFIFRQSKSRCFVYIVPKCKIENLEFHIFWHNFYNFAIYRSIWCIFMSKICQNWLWSNSGWNIPKSIDSTFFEFLDSRIDFNFQFLWRLVLLTKKQIW